MSPIAILRRQFQRVPLGFVVAETYAALQADMATGAIKPRTLEEFEEIAGHVDVFFDDDQLVATVGVLPYGEYGELSMFWVAPCYRQLHLSQKLIAHAFYLAALRSYQFLFACTVVPRVRQVFLLAGFDEVSPACVPAENGLTIRSVATPGFFFNPASISIHGSRCAENASGADGSG